MEGNNCLHCGYKDHYETNWYYEMAETPEQRQTAIEVLSDYERQTGIAVL